MTHLPHTTNLTERVLRVRFCLPAYPFLPSFFLQNTTGTTRTDTALLGTMTGETATAVIETGTGIVTTDATGKEDTTGIAIDGTMIGGLDDTKEEGDIDENARKDLAQGATTRCKLTALLLQRVTAAATVIEEGAQNVAEMVWALQSEGALPQQMRSHSL